MDLLLIIWLIVTIIMFIDLFLPHPLYIFTKPITIGLFFILLFALIIRMLFRGIKDIMDVATHPAVLAFVATIVALYLFKKIEHRTEKKKR
jgi:hypothetical protein